LYHLCLVHEKGALRTTFDALGQPEPPVLAPGIAVPPPALRADILALLAQEFAQTMFPGDPKEVIISPEMRVGVDYAAFQADQQRLVTRLQELLVRYGCAADFQIDPTRIATDVEDKRLGKALGARRVLEWLTERSLAITRFITFGDSPSDLAMAEEIHRQGYPVVMVYVGEAAQVRDRQDPFPLVVMQERCECGTVEYLRQHLAHQSP
jgi:hypothetical protein